MLSEPLRAIERSGSLADATKASYSRSWRQFAEWTKTAGYELPSSTAVAAYLQHLADDGKKMATLNAFLAAAKKVHLLMGWPDLSVLEVVEAQKRLRREIGGPQKQAIGLTEEGMAAIRETAREPAMKRGGVMETAEEARARGDVDIALVSLMRDGMLRISEAAALKWRDVFPQADGTGRVVVARSKTDQGGEGQMVYVWRRAMAALAVLRPQKSAPDALVFGGATRFALARRIGRICERAGLGRGYSGHSPRVGFAQDAVAKGAQLPGLMVAGRWKSSAMPARYTAALSLTRGLVAWYYGETGSADVVSPAPQAMAEGSRQPDPAPALSRAARRRMARRDGHLGLRPVRRRHH